MINYHVYCVLTVQGSVLDDEGIMVKKTVLPGPGKPHGFVGKTDIVKYTIL